MVKQWRPLELQSKDQKTPNEILQEENRALFARNQLLAEEVRQLNEIIQQDSALEALAAKAQREKKAEELRLILEPLIRKQLLGEKLGYDDDMQRAVLRICQNYTYGGRFGRRSNSS